MPGAQTAAMLQPIPTACQMLSKIAALVYVQCDIQTVNIALVMKMCQGEFIADIMNKH